MGEAARRKKLGLGPRPARDPAADTRRLTLAAAALFRAVGVPPLADLVGTVLVVDYTRGGLMPGVSDRAELRESDRTLTLMDRKRVAAWIGRWMNAPGRVAFDALPDATTGALPALELSHRSASIDAADLRALVGAGDVPLWPELAP